MQKMDNTHKLYQFAFYLLATKDSREVCQDEPFFILKQLKRDLLSSY